MSRIGEISQGRIHAHQRTGLAALRFAQFTLRLDRGRKRPGGVRSGKKRAHSRIGGRSLDGFRASSRSRLEIPSDRNPELRREPLFQILR